MVSARAVVLFNAKVYTRHLPAPSALLIVDGRIAWMGSDDQAKQFDDANRVDCEGKWLAPAFADAHVHITNTGIEITGLNLKGVHNAADLAERVASFAGLHRDVVVGHGWDDTDWPLSPTSENIESDVPVYLSRVDVHSAVVNRALVRHCPEIVNLEGWSESGWVTQAAHGLARATAFSLMSDESKRRARVAMLERCAALGIVAVDEMAGPVVSSVEDAQAVVELGRSHQHPEVFLWWGELHGFETARNIDAYGCGGDLFVDGSLGSHTACLFDPYEDGGQGVSYISRENILEHVRRAQQLRMPTGFHAIGDKALDDVFFAYESAEREFGGQLVRELGHRVEHAEMTRASHFEAAARLNIGLSVQPQFDALWAGPGGMYEQRIGARAASMNDFVAMSAAGASLVFGSDAPVTDLNPWQSIAAATQMHRPESSVSPRLAFASHTRSFWRQRHVHDCGEIALNSRASLVLWDVPEFQAASENLTGQRWSLDPRSGISPLPDLQAGLPTALQVWKYGKPMLLNGPGWTNPS